MTRVITNVSLGLVLAGLISTAALRRNALTPDGAAASTVVGALVFVAGGIAWSAPLLAFFATSSFLSQTRRPMPNERMPNDGSRRTARQVLANGGVPALCAMLQVWRAAPVWPVLFAAAIAAATADTWATEIGPRSTRPPVDIRTGQTVPIGTSGGVTTLGLAASVTGSAFIAAVVTLFMASTAMPLVITLSGATASIIDSLLGATAQEVRWCGTCHTETEQTVHRTCGSSTIRMHGVPGFDNDLVNVLASLSGGVVAFLLLLAGART